MDTVSTPTRFVGLDVHKYYLIAVGVDAQRNLLFGPQRVALHDLDAWMAQRLTPSDEVVLEMTTNTWQLYDDLAPHVHSVTIVHPPHLALITRARVMTDAIAAKTLASLHAAGLVPALWIPPEAVRDRRALVAHRTKMVRLATQCKNRLHAVLHRYHQAPPEGNLFAPKQRDWWLHLPVGAVERTRIETDLDTLDFAEKQRCHLEQALITLAAGDAQMPLLIQLPGFSLITALTVLAAIGDIRRFPDAQHLVGYAGFGTVVHDSGLTSRHGGITKAGRRELRAAMVEAAHSAANTHPHWQAEFARLEPRLGSNKAVVAIARKLLVSVWHVLAEQAADRFADPERVGRKFMQFTHRLGRANPPAGQSAAAYAREQLDRLGLGSELESIHWGPTHPIALPPSKLSREKPSD